MFIPVYVDQIHVSDCWVLFIVGTEFRKKAIKKMYLFLLYLYLQSDASGSSGSSVLNVLGARKVDAESVLIALGFGPSEKQQKLQRIPDRFLAPSKVKLINQHWRQSIDWKPFWVPYPQTNLSLLLNVRPSVLLYSVTGVYLVSCKRYSQLKFSETMCGHDTK